jgi:hypothetical protein
LEIHVSPILSFSILFMVSRRLAEVVSPSSPTFSSDVLNHII